MEMVSRPDMILDFILHPAQIDSNRRGDAPHLFDRPDPVIDGCDFVVMEFRDRAAVSCIHPLRLGVMDRDRVSVKAAHVGATSQVVIGTLPVRHRSTIAGKHPA